MCRHFSIFLDFKCPLGAVQKPGVSKGALSSELTSDSSLGLCGDAGTDLCLLASAVCVRTLETQTLSGRASGHNLSLATIIHCSHLIAETFTTI